MIQAVVSSDPFSAIAAGKNIKELVFHMPTILFWDKMKRYLMGTFSCYNDQVKMSKKFHNSNSEYSVFVKKQIHLVNEIDDDKKIDYFAALTRCFLLTDLEENLFFKLSKFIMICTPEELDFLYKIPYKYHSKNNIFVSSLYQYGLFVQDETIDGVTYILSGFGKALKQNSLNFECGLNGELRITSYTQIPPLSIAEAIPVTEVQKIFNDPEMTVDGGLIE